MARGGGRAAGRGEGRPAFSLALAGVQGAGSRRRVRPRGRVTVLAGAIPGRDGAPGSAGLDAPGAQQRSGASFLLGGTCCSPGRGGGDSAAGLAGAGRHPDGGGREGRREGEAGGGAGQRPRKEATLAPSLGA